MLERLLRPRSVFRRETTRQGETRPRTDLRTRCRGRCRGVSRDSVYIVLRDRETPDRQSARSDLWGVPWGGEKTTTPFFSPSRLLRNSRRALFRRPRPRCGATQIRRTLFRKGEPIEINIFPRFIPLPSMLLPSSIRSVF